MKKITLILTMLLVATLSWQTNAQCISNTPFGSGTLSSSSTTPVTFTTCAWAGERSTVTVNDAGIYRFTSSIATDFLTFTNESNVVVGFGTTPLDVPVTTTGVYRLHVHANAACGTASGCRALAGQYLSPIPPTATPISCTGNQGPTSAADTNLLSFQIAGINGTEINFTNACPGVTGLQNQTSQVVDLYIGSEYTLNVASWTCGISQFTANTNVWVDFNGDGVLTNDERVLMGTQTFVSQGGPNGTAPTGGVAFTATFTIPANAVEGPVIIRAKTQETSITALNPCGSYSWGSLIDFTANLIENPIVGSPPQIVCPLNITVNSSSYPQAECGAQVFFNDAQAFDPEDGLIPVVQTMGPPTGSIFPVGVTTIEFSATDSDGNTSTCQFTVTVIDDIDPIAVCQNFTLELDANGIAVLDAELLNFGAGPSAPAIPIVCTGNPGPTSVADTNLVSFSIDGDNFTSINYTNSCPGITGLQNQTALSVDLIPGQTYTVNANSWTCGTTQYTAQTYIWIDFNRDGSLTADEVVLTGSQTFFSGGGPTGANPTGGNPFTNTFTVPADAEIGSAIIRVMTQETSTTPLLPCASYTWGSMIDFTANIVQDGGGSSDACGPVSFAFNQSGTMTSMTFDCSDLGENMVTLWVIDQQGNAVSCDVMVTIEDNTPPEIVCLGGGVPDLTTVTCPGNPGPSSAADTNLLSFSLVGVGGTEIDFINNCPGVTGLQNQTALSVDLLPGQTYTVNANSWSCGASQWTAQTYVWIDFNGDGVLSSDEVVLTGSHAFVSGGGPTGANPTGGNPFSNSFTVPANAHQGPVIIRAMTQETSVTPLLPCASFTWGSMIDFTANILNPNPGGVPQYFLDANGQVSVPITDLYVSVSDNSGACGITVTAGGAGATACQLSNPSNNFENGNSNTAALNRVVAHDILVPAGESFVLESITFNQFVLPPATIASVNVFYYSNAGTLPGAIIGQQMGIVPISQDVIGSNFGFNIRQTLIDVDDFTFEGQAGSDTTYWIGISVLTTASDNTFWETTTASIVGNGTAYNPGTGVFEPVSPQSDGVYSFNGTCTGLGGGGGTVFTCDDLGFTTVTVTATDAAGNSTSCTTMIEIIDNIPPVLVTQDIVVELDENGQATVTYEDFYAFSPDDYHVIAIGSDGLTGAGSTDLTVPVSEAVTVSFDWNYTTTDAPGWDSFGYLINGVYTQLTSDAVGNQSGSQSVSLSAGDVFGFRVLSDDNFGGAGQVLITEFEPGFTGQFAPDNWTEVLTNSNGSATFIVIPGGVLAYDNCGITTGAVDISTFTCADIGTPVTVTVFVSDSSGNIASSTAVVTVVDLLAPVIECPEDMIVDTDEGSITYTLPDYFGEGIATATDNCTEPVTVFGQSPAPGTLLLDGIHTITLTAEDEYGNVSECSFVLTVETILGDDDNLLADTIIMYPNPAESYVSIRNSSQIELTEATIYDINGKLISKFDLTQMSGEQRLDVSGLASGVYMVIIQSETASAVKRLIKK